MRNLFLAIVGACLLLSSCAPGETPKSTPTDSPLPAELGLVDPTWTNNDLPVLSKPVVVDNVIVAYVQTGSTLAIAGFDPADGKRIWTQPAHVNFGPTGVELSVSKVEFEGAQRVAFLAEGSDLVRAVIADAKTGKILIQTKYFFPISMPSKCESGGVCVQGMVPPSDSFANWEIRADGSFAQTREPKLPAGSYRIDKGIYLTAASSKSKNPELGFMKADKVLWQRPYVDVFGAGADPDHGWAWDEKDDALVGLGFRPSKVKGTRDMRSGTLVSLEPATGKELWSVPGADYCYVSWGEHPEHVHFCVFKSGTITYKDSQPTYSDVKGTLESRERVSGKVRWSVPLDAANYGSWGGVPFSSPSGEAIRYSGGAVKRINLATGKTTEVPADGVLACIEHRPGFKIPEADESQFGRKKTSDIIFPCAPDRAPKTQFSVAAVKDAGIRVGEVVVLLGKDGLQAFKLPA